MQPETWAKIKELFLEAMEIAPEERSGFLREKCSGDELLRAELEKMLAEADVASGLMSRPAIENSAVQLIAESLNKGDTLIGEKFGAYRLVKELGRGGMGAVYLAERVDGAFRRKVAVKLVKRGMETETLLRRFRSERQILAALNHPNIAQLFDGGAASDGTPYFVMEYVAGEPLYRFCDNRKLTVKKRLEIFLQICEAVRAAHQMHVVHRDLKPSNLLVTAAGQIKLLDFGIAKLLDPDLSDSTAGVTGTQMRLMTPEYASPEQISGEPISPASDIYSLGVILYELLSGHRPYQFNNHDVHEIARVVCEHAPKSLSDSLNSRETFLEKGAAATLENILDSRNSNLIELRREFSGDLERIVMHALAKRPANRYQSATDLAADIQVYLENKPVKKRIALAPEQTISVKVDKPSLAVLPLQMIGREASANHEGAYLSVGLADAMITRLSNIGQIVVRPTSSVLHFGDQPDAVAAGRELNANYVLTGTIRQAGGRIRVSAQLLDIRTRGTVWAEKFDENSTDVLELEDSISEQVTNALVPRLTATEKQKLARRETNDAYAYEAYMKGRFHWNQFTPESLPKALEAFQQAVHFDPDYSLAYVGLADFYIWANIYGLIPSRQALAEAEKHGLRAVELNPSLGEAYATLSFVAQSRRQWTRAEELKLKALNLVPDYQHAHEWYADQLIATGKTDRGIHEAVTAEKLAPSSLRTKLMVSFAFYQAHRFEEALARAWQILDLDKNYPSGYSATGISLCGMKRFDEALFYLVKFNELVPDSAYVKYQFCFALAKAGKIAEARENLEQIKTLARHAYVKPYFLALAHAAVGERDEAFQYFEQSFAEDDPWMLWFATEPMLEDIRNDARYSDLLRRMNYPRA